MAKCLVLGANGFIGSHLVDSLAAQGHQVRAFGRTHAGSHPLWNPSPLVEQVSGDFNHEGDVMQALDGCDICFHLISTTLPKSSNDDPAFDVDTNIGGTVKLLQNAVRLGLKKIIFLSSGGTVYGIPKTIPIAESHPTEPICSYGITKLAIEKYLELYRHLHGLDYTVLRLSNPFGERQRTAVAQGAIAVFLNKALKNESIEIWGDGSVVRDYIYISDAINALSKSIYYNGDQRVLNIGSGHGKSINEIIASIEMVVGHEVKKSYRDARPFDVAASVLSTKIAAENLDWRPEVSFEEGLAKTVNWLRSQSR